MEDPKIVFILGSQRGGTTIFGRLLGEVEGFALAGEVRRLWRIKGNRPCSCGLANVKCPLWSEVLRQVLPDAISLKEVSSWQGRHLSNRHSWFGALRLMVDSTRHCRPPATLDAFADVTNRLYRAVADLTGARVVVDTSKHPNDAILLSQRSALRSYFVQIVRDPRGSAFSVEQRDSARLARQPSAPVAARRWVLRAVHTGRATLNWLARHGVSEAVRRTVPSERSLLVRYEDLAERPVEVLQRVATLVGEQPDHFPSFDGGKVHLRMTHSPSCAKSLPAATVAFRLDDRWISGLPQVDAIVATALAWPLMRRYGYRLRRPRPLSAVPASVSAIGDR